MQDNSMYMSAMKGFVAPELQVKDLPPIIDFLQKYDRGSMPYPRQSTILKLIFLDTEHFTDYDRMVIDQWRASTVAGGEVTIQLDIYDRIETLKKLGRKHFGVVIVCGGRRGGKGFMGGKMAAYKTAQMISLASPQRYYGLDESKPLCCDVFATTYGQAQKNLYNDIKDAILMNEWLAPYLSSTSNASQHLWTPYDKVREDLTKRKASGKVNSTFSSIEIAPLAFVSTSLRGHASYLQCYDEFAHGINSDSNISTEVVYDAAVPSLQQLGGDGLIYIPSSPWSEIGKFYSLYEDAFKMENGKAVHPEIFAIRLPSWVPYEDWEYDPTKRRALILPPEKDPDMASKEKQNPESFNVEFRANFAKTEDAYISPTMVDRMLDPFPSETDNKNVMRDHGSLQIRYRAHADAGRSQDNFSYACGHKEIGPDGYWHVYIDRMKVWRASDFPLVDGARRINYVDVLSWIKNDFRYFPVRKFSMDQWNSAYIIDSINTETDRSRFADPMTTAVEDTHTAGSNFKRWERFKTAVYQGWVHAPYIEEDIPSLGKGSLLSAELKYLVVKNGNKVELAREGFGHGDLADSVSTIVADLLGDQLDMLDNGNLVQVQGGAQGGFGLLNNAPVDAQWDTAMRNQSAALESMGYGVWSNFPG